MLRWGDAKTQLAEAVRQTAATDLRWSYLIITGLAVVGVAVNFLLPHGWTVWPVVLAVGLLVMINEASDRNGQGPVDYKPRNSFSTSFSLSQVINTRFQALFVVEPSYQKGLLATEYKRDYFTDGSERIEHLPESRYKLPVGVRFNYFIDDHFIIRTFYRYYMDNWGIRAHTAEIEVPIKFTSFVSVSPYYRYNNQEGARYFTPYGQHSLTAIYYTSDYDLSTMHSNFIGVNLRLSPPNGVFGIQQLNSLELRYGHYMRSTGLNSDIVTLALKFK